MTGQIDKNSVCGAIWEWVSWSGKEERLLVRGGEYGVRRDSLGNRFQSVKT